jgi:hypothetical protein
MIGHAKYRSRVRLSDNPASWPCDPVAPESTRTALAPRCNAWQPQEFRINGDVKLNS